MILFKNVTKTYYPLSGQIIALKNVSFEVEEKEFLTIVGKSGAGKTTLLKLLLAEEKPVGGEVFFEDQNVHQIPAGKIPYFRRKIGVIFQDYKLLSSKTAYENIAFARQVVGASEEEIANDVPKVLELVGLTNRAHNFPQELSGGEKQRLVLARALVNRPKVILADEPTGNLDPYNTRDIVRLLLKVHQLGTTVILASHNKEVVNLIGKRVITLDEGKLIRDDKEGKFIL